MRKGPSVREGKEGFLAILGHLYHALPDKVSLAHSGTCMEGECGKGRQCAGYIGLHPKHKDRPGASALTNAPPHDTHTCKPTQAHTYTKRDPHIYAHI